HGCGSDGANVCLSFDRSQWQDQGGDQASRRGGWLIPIVTGDIFGPGPSRVGRPHVPGLGSAAP
ncbi:MAG: hypothetical protein ACYCZP_17215, partial [Acidimicrobiales bacterium]